MIKLIWELNELLKSRGLMIFTCVLLSVFTSAWILIPIIWMIIRDKIVEDANQPKSQKYD